MSLLTLGVRDLGVARRFNPATEPGLREILGVAAAAARTRAVGEPSLPG